MSSSGFDVEEAKARLNHLLSMPETPVRAREIAALRRSLELIARNGPMRKRRASSTRNSPKSVAAERPRPQKPLK
ncbi:MAG: hypothetical protein GF350_06295, partial [Chitinivibrionales bacterium]|nr:hypothetical protein [Chitinivibrionales bacterium]